MLSTAVFFRTGGSSISFPTFTDLASNDPFRFKSENRAPHNQFFLNIESSQWFILSPLGLRVVVELGST